MDFHLHSYASNVTDYYAANTFGIPESYSEPLKLYRMLKARGMTLVTLTDHNSIDGVKELLDHGFEDVFISSEMTTTFPEDGCNIHVTVANVTESQFAEIQRLRKNVYEMIAYVDGEIATERERPGENRIAYFMTHPLMSTQNRPYGREGSLAIEHIERVLLLCNCLEIQNGARTRALNELTRRMLDSLTEERILHLADRHGIEPKGETPWIKAYVGGSDDHAGINAGNTWTEFRHGPGRATANDVVDAIRRRDTSPGGAHGGPVTLAHSVLKLLHDGSRRSSAASQPRVAVGGPVQTVLRMVFEPEARRSDRLRLSAKVLVTRLVSSLAARARLPRRAGASFEQVFETEVCRMMSDRTLRDKIAALDSETHTDERAFLVVGTLLNGVFSHYMDDLRSTSPNDLVGLIKQAVALVASNAFVSLPYLMSFFAQSSDCLIARDVRRTFGLSEPHKVVVLTDTFFEVNGVAATIRRMIREAIRRDLDFTVVTCLGEDEIAEHTRDPEIRDFVARGHLKILTAVSRLAFPEYDRLQIRFPPFLELLKYLQECGFTKMQISTPGVIGLYGLAAAKTLQIETAATYHTSIPEYVENYTRDISLEALAWKYMIAFYHAVDEVLVPSKFIARLLHKRGLRNRKLLVLDRWVDVDRFHPRHRTPGFWEELGIEGADELVKFIYVGRLGVEKNLKFVAEAFRKLCDEHPLCHLILVGDGPYRAELERRLAGLPVTFTGFLERTSLSRAYASADVKLFPSTTDTWGNAPVEAQASGLPVIVSSVGGPAELMVDGVTGLQIGGHDVDEFVDAMVRLLDRDYRETLGRNARAYAEERRVDEPFTAVFDADAYRRRLKDERERDDVVAEGADLARVYFVEPAGTEAKSVA